MVKVYFIYSNKEFHGLLSKGHSKYNSKGTDIVCAAVSSLIQAFINGLKKVVRIKLDLKKKVVK